VSGSLISNYRGGGKSPGFTSAWDSVTHRERQVLKLVAEGHPNKYIADYLSLSVKTVEKHRSNLMRKLNLRNVSMLTAFAIEKGLVHSESGLEKKSDGAA
jgi:DNA-binding NarL/FixJ family response regulator